MHSRCVLKASLERYLDSEICEQRLVLLLVAGDGEELLVGVLDQAVYRALLCLEHLDPRLVQLL